MKKSIVVGAFLLGLFSSFQLDNLCLGPVGTQYFMTGESPEKIGYVCKYYDYSPYLKSYP